jgi:ribosomal protein S14
MNADFKDPATDPKTGFIRFYLVKKGSIVARTALIFKAKQEPKFKARRYNRCPRCGRPRGYYRKFDLCRICFRQLASRGEIPGVVKSSW